MTSAAIPVGSSPRRSEHSFSKLLWVGLSWGGLLGAVAGGLFMLVGYISAAIATSFPMTLAVLFVPLATGLGLGIGAVAGGVAAALAVLVGRLFRSRGGAALGIAIGGFVGAAGVTGCGLYGVGIFGESVASLWALLAGGVATTGLLRTWRTGTPLLPRASSNALAAAAGLLVVAAVSIASVTLS